MIDLKNITALLEPATKGFIVLAGDEDAISGSVRGTNKDLAELLLNAAVKSDDFFLSMILAVEATRRKKESNEKEKGGEEC